jgi:hypothetical protein
MQFSSRAILLIYFLTGAFTLVGMVGILIVTPRWMDIVFTVVLAAGFGLPMVALFLQDEWPRSRNRE